MELHIHPSAVIHDDAELAEGVRVGPYCVIESGVSIGAGTILEAKVVISKDVKIGENNHFFPNCVIGCRPQTLNLSLDDEIDNGAWFSGLSGSHQFVTIGKWCYVAGLAGITRDIPPFLTISGHYPPRVRGVNKRGLERAGLNEQQQERIFEAYKRLYRKPGSLLENVKALAQENGLDENVQAMIDSITKSSQHQYGRYLETFR
jgi:UDP-N-acetylglucosamine acyltransferase